MSHRIWSSVFCTICLLHNLPALPQISEEQARFELRSLVLPEPTGRIAPYSLDVWRNINENPESYLVVVRKDLALPQDVAILSDPDSLLYYELLYGILFIIENPETKDMRLQEYKRFKTIYEHYNAAIEADNSSMSDEGHNQLIDATGNLDRLYGYIVHKFQETKDNSIVEDCLERLKRDHGGLTFIILDYLEEVAPRNPVVFDRLIQIYENPKSFWFHDNHFIKSLNRIKGIVVEPKVDVRLVNNKGQLLLNGSLQFYEGSWKDAENHGNGTFTVNTGLPSVKLRMIYEHGVQEMSNVPVNGSTVVFKTIPANVQLKNSQKQLIDAGTVQYYSGSWYDLGVTSDGVAKKELLPANYKFRMSYAHASNEKYQDVGIDSMVVFQTVPTKVELRNSQSALIDTGVVKYYSGGWYDLGVTTSGIATMELLPYNYKFRMTYAKGSNEKYQDVGTNPTVIFQTTNALVELRNSQGNLMDGGVVQYYSGAWYNLGSTAGGMAALELLPYNYKFRITYAKGSNEKYQDIGMKPIVVFQTTNARVELRNSQRNLMDKGVVQYYSGAWYNLGSTAGGVAAMELLPYNYKFRITYAKGSNEKYQDIGVNPTVVFQTSNARVEIRNSQGNLMDGGAVQYYSGAWYDLGSTSGGVAAMELLPYNYKFRMTYAKGSNEQYQDIGVNPTVVFQTINVRVEIRNSQGNLMDGGVVQYYSGAWYNLGSTSGGVAAMELLPYNYKFRMTYANGSNEKYQDIGVNSVVPFQTVLATVKANNLQGQSLNNIDVKYYSGAWYPFGLTLNGTATKELLPFPYKFRVTSGSVQSEKYQDLTTNPVVEFSINAIGG